MSRLRRLQLGLAVLLVLAAVNTVVLVALTYVASR